jgi:hypothetical protein
MKHNARASKRGSANHRKNSERKSRRQTRRKNNVHSPVPNRNSNDDIRVLSVTEQNEREIIGSDDSFNASPVREDFIFD